MKTERVLVALLAVSAITLAIQGFTLYRQFARPPIPPTVREAPEGTFLDISGLPIQGSSDAKVVLVEFSDYECPFCARHATGVAKEISRDFIMNGKIRQTFVNNPLDIHANAVPFAAVAICAGAQGHYWEMHQALFESRPKTIGNALVLAKRVLQTVDIETLERCLDAPDTNKRIDLDRATARTFEMATTPAFAMGRVQNDGRLRILRFVRGAQPFELFRSEITKVINTPS